jgi:hypothetical protein
MLDGLFGHNAFAAISYTSAVLTANHGWEPIAAGALGLSGALACALIVATRRCACAATISRWQRCHRPHRL